MTIQMLKRGSSVVATLALLGFLFYTSPACATPINLLTNGSFEDGKSFSGLTNIVNGDITAWTTSAGYWYFENAGGWGTAQDGTRFVEFDGPSSPSLGPISQSFAVTANTTYDVSFWAGIRRDGAADQDTITAAITLGAGSATGTLSTVASSLIPIGMGVTPTGWQQFSFSFTPNSNTTATLTLDHPVANQYGSVDNVSVTAVPEPSTLALLGTGLFGLLAYAWRKRK